MFGVGASELLVIALVALLVVGPKKLPDLAKSLGKGFSEFRKATEGVTDGIKETFRADDLKEEIHSMKDSLLYGTGDSHKDDPQPEAPVEGAKKTDPYADPNPSARS